MRFSVIMNADFAKKLTNKRWNLCFPNVVWAVLSNLTVVTEDNQSKDSLSTPWWPSPQYTYTSNWNMNALHHQFQQTYRNKLWKQGEGNIAHKHSAIYTIASYRVFLHEYTLNFWCHSSCPVCTYYSTHYWWSWCDCTLCTGSFQGSCCSCKPRDLG